MARRSTMTRWGIPIIAVTIVLVFAIARVGAGDDDDQPGNGPGGERQVERVTIEQVSVNIAESYPVQVFVDVTGTMPDPCWEAQEPAIEEKGARIEIEIVAERDPDEVCAQVVQEYQKNIALGTMEPGEYVVEVNGVESEFEVY